MAILAITGGGMPAITISKATIDQAKSGERDLFFWDRKLSGFGLKVTPTGVKVYICQYRTGGRGSPTKRVTIGRHGAPWTPDQARHKAKAILGKVADGGDPAAEKRAEREASRRRDAADHRSLEALGERWFSHLRREGKRSANEVERSFKRHVYPELGKRLVEQIQKGDAHRLYDGLADVGHAPMGHQLVRNLKALLSFAVERDLIAVNPLLRIKLPKLETRDRTLIAFHPEREPDPAELLAVWRAADQLSQPRGPFVKMLILTLGREDEVAGAEWAELDRTLWRIPKERHKGNRGHDVPLSTQVVELLEALPRVTKHVEGQGQVEIPHIFYTGRGQHIGDFSGIKAQIDRLSGVHNWRFHDLRRTGSSWIEEEFGREVMHACLGHSMGDRLAETYARGAGYQRKKRALQAWADYITEATIEGKVVPMIGRH
jgi:integrase